jgi:monoamine oxidase
MTPWEGEDTDVVIIGAGLSGLVAANQIQSHGARVTVIESSSRVGGRLLTRRLKSGEAIELGARFVGTAHCRVRQLCEKFGVGLTERTIPVTTDLLPDTVVVDGHRSSDRQRRLIATELDAAIEDAIQEASRLDCLAMDKLLELDKISLGDWLLQRGHGVYAREFFSDIPSDFQSAYGLLSLVHGVRGRSLFETNETFRFEHGASSLISSLTAALSTPVLLERKAISILPEDNGVKICIVDPQNREQFVRAGAVIVCIPTSCWKAIAMPLDRNISVPKMVQHRYIVGRARIRQSSVELAALSAISDSACRLVWTDNVQRDGLCTVVTTHLLARQGYSGFNASPGELLTNALSMCGQSEIEELEVAEHPWIHCKRFLGTYSSYGPGVLTSGFQSSISREPRIRFAGDAIANEFCGFMEGAVRTAERASREALSTLGGGSYEACQ